MRRRHDQPTQRYCCDGEPAAAGSKHGVLFSALRQLRWLRTREDGYASALVCLCMVSLTGFLGLAIDAGNLRFAKRTLQTAADAAAVAGALEVKQCAGTAVCGTMITATQQALVENGYSASSTTYGCAPASGSGLLLTINNGPCALGSNDPNQGKITAVEVVLTRTTPTLFARIFGLNSFPITVRAEAARPNATNCVVSLDSSAGNAVSVDALAMVSGKCGILDESSAWNALSCNILASIQMSQVAVVGGVQSLLACGSLVPKTGILTPLPSDPLASLPKPTVGSCGTSTSSPFYGAPSALAIAGNVTLNPGTYCGGINILPLANVTFRPGTYVITSGTPLLLNPGGLQVDAGATVNGSGVTFYNYGPYGGVNFTLAGVLGSGVTLTAPTTGTYAGILFYQDGQNTSPATILGTSAWNTDIEGTHYFPSAKVIYALSGAAKYDIIVAKTVDFAVLTLGTTTLKASTIGTDYSSLVNGSPIAGSAAVLVQ